MTALDTLELRDPVADQALKWCRQRRQQGLPFDLPQALADFSDGELRTWLDQVRLQQPPDCARAMDEALRMLPASRDLQLREERQRRLEQSADGPSDAHFASLQRRIQIRSADDQD